MSRLRIVIVNHCHPETRHVCATRARELAAALSRGDHEIILLTETLAPGDRAPPPDAVAAALAGHDWSHPFRLACPPVGHGVVARARRGGLPRAVNRAVLAWAYTVGDGPFADWVDGSRPYWPAIADAFRPDATLAVFGNTGAIAIARGIAARAGAPWALDLKDSWRSFIPAAVRRLVARRAADAAAVIALSEGHAGEAAAWFDRQATVVYSGIPATALEAPAARAEASEPLIALVGSVHDPAPLAVLADGIRSWLAANAGANPPRVVYYGGDDDRVRAALGVLDGLCRVECRGYRPLPELLAALRRARVSIYVRNPRVLFHHKIFELASCGRPILCLPGESEEAVRLVREVGGRLYSCTGAADVCAALDAVWRAGDVAPAPDLGRLARYTWDAQSAVLARVMERATERATERANGGA